MESASEVTPSRYYRKVVLDFRPTDVGDAHDFGIPSCAPASSRKSLFEPDWRSIRVAPQMMKEDSEGGPRPWEVAVVVQPMVGSSLRRHGDNRRRSASSGAHPLRGRGHVAAMVAETEEGGDAAV
ncbi:hypothetical protein CDL15_Pgr018622 [Punica granatum]|uniref:Uncharacterized protein n=1 Tax=Punica granatum TaxID=22663 RepID=A0A218WZG5_PUNGR|nr:hypothetical protein CDL15_Pgr018622 [Punica granatum]